MLKNSLLDDPSNISNCCSIIDSSVLSYLIFPFIPLPSRSSLCIVLFVETFLCR